MMKKVFAGMLALLLACAMAASGIAEGADVWENLWTAEMASAAPAEEAGSDVPDASSVRVDSTVFPDADFREYVATNYDKDGNGYLSPAEIDAAKGLSIGYVSSVKGIRKLKKLVEIDLYQIDSNEALDLSGFKSLKIVQIYRCGFKSVKVDGCSKLEHLNLYFSGISQKTLKPSGCKALKQLNCGMTPKMTVDISGCPYLVKAFLQGKKKDAVEGEDRWDYRPVTYKYGSSVLYVDAEDTVKAGKNLPKRVTLNKTGTVNLKLKKTLKLKAKVKPAKAPTRLTWKSSKPSVAKVDAGGKVTARKPGVAKITVTTENGKKASVKVNVPAPQPTKVKITKGKKATIEVGKKLALKAKLYPTGAKSALTWSSSDEKVATVSKKGVVKALKAGAATITVKTENGKTASIAITVKPKPSAVELSGYFLKGVEAAEKKLGLKRAGTVTDDYDRTYTVYKNNQVKLRYVKKWGVTGIELLSGTQYKLCGVQCGMDFTKACDNAIKYMESKVGKNYTKTLNKGQYLMLISNTQMEIDVYGKKGKVSYVLLRQYDKDFESN